MVMESRSTETVTLRTVSCPGAPGGVGTATAAALLVLCLVQGGVSHCHASPATMRGPHGIRPPAREVWEAETAVPSLVFQGAIRAFQKYVSPTDGDRCGFSPTCSEFGRAAVAGRGPVVGILVTADRLMRCTFFKGPGPDYLTLPDGKLFDPVENNLLSFP